MYYFIQILCHILAVYLGIIYIAQCKDQIIKLISPFSHFRLFLSIFFLFQLEDRNIELEGTRARVRLLEKPLAKTSSPDIIPLESPSERRSEITTSSMKNMSPLPMMMDHSSSTESAHDQAEKERKEGGSGSNSKRRPSKIPLKSYTAPKPPGGKFYERKSGSITFLGKMFLCALL